MSQRVSSLRIVTRWMVEVDLEETPSTANDNFVDATVVSGTAGVDGVEE